MKLGDICKILEDHAPLNFQENYDNSGIQIGHKDLEITGILICIDITTEVISEAKHKNCNLIISHHPLIFKPLKSIQGINDVEKCIIESIKNNIAIYSAHTNMDNVINGVSGKMAEKLSLINNSVLLPVGNKLYKLVTFVPKLHSYRLRDALFNAGAGNIGNYDKCSFNSDGYGTFRASIEANPFVGEVNKLHNENETRIEVIFTADKKSRIIETLLAVHPYEEPAFDIINLENHSLEIGAGIMGELPEDINEEDFIKLLKALFNCKSIRSSGLLDRKIKRVALCGGSGSFLINEAIKKGADVFITGDMKYHDYFLAEKNILLLDIGHFESEQYTKDVFYEIITKKFPTFAIQISEINTNPINYL